MAARTPDPPGAWPLSLRAMVRQFHGSCLPETSSRTHPQAGGLKLLLVLLIHSVVAVVLLGVVIASAKRMKPRARQDLQSFFAGALRAIGAAVREGA